MVELLYRVVSWISFPVWAWKMLRLRIDFRRTHSDMRNAQGLHTFVDRCTKIADIQLLNRYYHRECLLSFRFFFWPLILLFLLSFCVYFSLPSSFLFAFRYLYYLFLSFSGWDRAVRKKVQIHYIFFFYVYSRWMNEGRNRYHVVSEIYKYIPGI